MKNRKRLAMAGAVLLGFVLGIGGTNAYLTSHDQMVNTIGIGKIPRQSRKISLYRHQFRKTKILIFQKRWDCKRTGEKPLLSTVM